MFKRRFHVLVLAGASMFCIASVGRIVSAQPVNTPSLKNEWRLETLRLTNDQEYRGLVLSESKSMVEFASLVRRPGKSMFTVVMGVRLERIARIVRLNGAERKQLVQRYEAFKNRAVVMLGRMDELKLQPKQIEDATVQLYHGDWFRLTSTANDEMTRRCIVRIEQILRAFRQLLPPLVDSPQQFDVRLFGSAEQYREFLRERNLPINNPAFYSTSQNMIVAGCELTRFSKRLELTRKHNEATRRRCVAMERDFGARKLELSQTYQQQGLSSQQIKAELGLQTAVWMEQKKRLLGEIAEADRRNTARFSAVTREMFRRLYHEAFHAYLETHVFPAKSHHVPRWLNEGLAQVFEGGRLEDDMLRVDAPRHDLLRLLQTELATGKRPDIRGMLEADDQVFLASHNDDQSTSSYKLSWGVAYYLLFEHRLLGSDRLQTYVDQDARRRDPLKDFEQLVGMPIDDFSATWSKWLQAQ